MENCPLTSSFDWNIAAAAAPVPAMVADVSTEPKMATSFGPGAPVAGFAPVVTFCQFDGVLQSSDCVPSQENVSPVAMV